MKDPQRAQDRETPSYERRRLPRRASGFACAFGTLLALAPNPGTGAASARSPTRHLGNGDLAFLEPLRGASGKLEVALRTAGQPLVPSPPQGLTARYAPSTGAAVVSREFQAPQAPGVYEIAVEPSEARNAVASLRVITLVPFSAKKNGRIGSYRLGQWPYEGGEAPSPAYANPAGFVEVTLENRDLPVSKHFTLGDFLTKDQSAVWPKYLVLDAGLLDKLELIIEELESAGYPVEHMAIMSGFRTPHYNQAGGQASGRGKLSRHMYGDATDIFVDNDRDGWTDDLNGDGRVDIEDARLVAQAADRAEARYPVLVGGVGTYAANRVHGPFTHVDVRGRRARWGG